MDPAAQSPSPVFDPSIPQELIDKTEMAHLEAYIPIMEEAEAALDETVANFLESEASSMQTEQTMQDALDQEADLVNIATHPALDADAVEQAQQNLSNTPQ
jgi:exonuclease VII small subunit